MIHSIKNPELFEVRSNQNDEACFGCDQDWYNSEWQRISGCGPTAASNLIYYMSKTKPGSCSLDIKNDRAGCLALMEKVWAYVTPTEEGVDTTKMFVTSMQAFLTAAGIKSHTEICDIPENKEERPSLKDVLGFLIRAMQHDAPVAFLNLCNGAESSLEAWHWVTIISLEYDTAHEHIYLKILDESQMKKIDLKLWYDTTALGGGFVYFSIPDD